MADQVRPERDRAGDVAVVTGLAQYAGDVCLSGMLHAKVLRSPYRRARFVVDPARALRDPDVVAVATHADVPDYRTDRPFLTDDARYVGDAVAAVAARTAVAAERALTLLDVGWRPLPAVTSAAEALAPGAPRVHEEGNVVSLGGMPQAGPTTYEQSHGPVADCFAGADLVVTETYRTPFQCHAHIEPHCCVARWRGDELEVWNSVQHPFSNQRTLAAIFGMEQAKVRVHCRYLGGGYGGKDSDDADKSHEDAIAALLAKKTRRPVRLALTHRENLTATSGRPPCRITLSVAASRSGQLLAVRCSVVQDAGAYADSGPRVLQVMASVLAASYRWEGSSFRGSSVYTNNPVGGEIWGFGSPEMTFALEQHLDLVASRLGLDPIALRRLNLPVAGDPLPGRAGEHLRYRQARGVDCLDVVAAAPPPRRPTSGSVRAGRGIRVNVENSGHESSDGVVAMDADGRVVVPVGIGNMGTGSVHAITRMVVEVLDLRPDQVTVRWGDSAGTAWDFGGDSSRALHCTGQAFMNAAYDLRAQLLDGAAELLDVAPPGLTLQRGVVRPLDGGGPSLPVEGIVGYLRAAGRARPARDPWFGGEHGGRRGRAWGRVAAPREATARLLEALPGVVGLGYGTRQFTRAGWAAQLADVEVDERTGEVRVRRLLTAADLGRVVSPHGALAQVQAGSVFATGWALQEALVVDPDTGTALTVELRELGVPTFQTAPEASARFLEDETPESAHAPLGLGETAVQAAAAIACAVARATGATVTELPLRPSAVPVRPRTEEGHDDDSRAGSRLAGLAGPSAGGGRADAVPAVTALDRGSGGRGVGG